MALAPAGDRLFFSADDGAHGRELWVSDGTAAGTSLVRDINTHFGVDVVSARPDTRNGSMRLRLRADAPGTLEVTPVKGSKLKPTSLEIVSTSRTSLVLEPNRAGMRELRRTGKLKVQAEFTFTPCSGAASSVVHRYTLKLR